MKAERAWAADLADELTGMINWVEGFRVLMSREQSDALVCFLECTEEYCRTLKPYIRKLNGPLDTLEQHYLRGFAAGQKVAMNRMRSLVNAEMEVLAVSDPEIELARREAAAIYEKATRESAQ